ncbi:hypothetical protein B0H12DRAFT_463958 [Mycena haematopus]|nr:hypothetical protein B0H12DRAFT_463958 [Mycena haematopus]
MICTFDRCMIYSFDGLSGRPSLVSPCQARHLATLLRFYPALRPLRYHILHAIRFTLLRFSDSTEPYAFLRRHLISPDAPHMYRRPPHLPYTYIIIYLDAFIFFIYICCLISLMLLYFLDFATLRFSFCGIFTVLTYMCSISCTSYFVRSLSS